MRRIVSLIAAMVFGAGLVAVAASPAAAHAYRGWGWCQGSVVCVSTNADGYGNGTHLNLSSPGTCRNAPWNDQISGIDSHVSTHVQFYINAGCTAAWFTLYGHSVETNLAWSGFNDRITSYCAGPAAQCND